MDTPEHSTKYQKLASEYAKVRAQNQVLKKAIVEEQQKSSKQNELLQALRKSEQENDSLNFRNQQLTCRLTLLQDDLHQLQHGSKSGHKKSGSSGGLSVKSEDGSSIHSGSTDGVDVEVLMQELQAKISENASLHARVSELEQSTFEREAAEQKLEQLAALQVQNREMTLELRHSMEALELHERTAKSKIEQLESEKVGAEVAFQQQARHVAKLKQQLLDAKITPPITPIHAGGETGSNLGVAGPPSSSSTLASPTSLSSSSSYMSLAPFSMMQDMSSASRDHLTGPPGGGQSQNTVALRLDLETTLNVGDGSEGSSTPAGGRDGLGGNQQHRLVSSVPIPKLSSDLCLRFASFIRVYCDIKKRKLSIAATDGISNSDNSNSPFKSNVGHNSSIPSSSVFTVNNISSSGSSEINNKAIETINKVLQGVEYWEKLAPLLEDVTQRTIGSNEGSCSSGVTSGLSSSSSAGVTNNSSTCSGSISTTTASTLAHLRIVSTISSSPGFQSTLRSIQSSWSAILPYLSALSANSNRAHHSQTTLVRLIGLLADRCCSLATAVEEAHRKWVVTEERDEDDSLVSQSLQELARVAEALTAALKMKLVIGLGQEQCGGVSRHATTGANDELPRGLVALAGSTVSDVGRGEAASSNCPTVRDSPQIGGVSTPISPPSPTSLSSPDDSNMSNLSSNASVNPSTNSIHSGNVLEANAARMAQLHRQREHWRLEYHLLSHKYNKMMAVLKDRKHGSAAYDAAGVAFDGVSAAGSGGQTNKVVPTSILGEVTFRGGDSSNAFNEGSSVVKDENGTAETVSSTKKDLASTTTVGQQESWRESMIRHHLTSRCTKLFLELTAMGSKATMFQDECEASLKRLQYCEQQRSGLEVDLESVREEKARLAEELRTTCNNYEEQISAMSEHLADVNEKIAYHEDQMAMRKQAPGKKGKK